MNWIEALPTIGTFLAGPAGGLAGSGIEWLASKLGASDKTVEGIKQTLSGMTPDQLLKAKEIDTEFKKFCMENSIKLDLAQIDVDKEEAKSTNWFVAGWRPGLGWVCVIILALAFIPKALALVTFWCVQSWLVLFHPGIVLPALPIFPDIGITDVMGILGTLLGAGWMAKLRTDEKMSNSESNR